MILSLRPFLITLLAFAVSLVLTVMALSTMIDLQNIGFQTEMPRHAVLTPMIAVVGFWGITRIFGVPLDPARTFLFGAIAIYGVLFFMGRVVSLTQINSGLATIVAVLVLYVACYLAVVQAQKQRQDAL